MFVANRFLWEKERECVLGGLASSNLITSNVLVCLVRAADVVGRSIS